MEALLGLVFIAGVLWIPYKIYNVLYVGEKPSETQEYDGWKCPKCGLINNLKGSTSCFCGYDKNKPVIEKREINPAASNTQKIIKPTPYEAPSVSSKFDDFGQTFNEIKKTRSSGTIKTEYSVSSAGKGRVIKTIGTVLAVVGILLVFAFAKVIGKIAGKSAVDNFNQGKLDGTIEKTLLETSKQINAQLPSMVDKETRADTTMCVGKHVQYKYTMINIAENEIDKVAFQNEINSMLVKNQCSNENVVKMLKLGVSYNYMYQDKNGAILAIININRADCGL